MIDLSIGITDQDFEYMTAILDYVQNNKSQLPDLIAIQVPDEPRAFRYIDLELLAAKAFAWVLHNHPSRAS